MVAAATDRADDDEMRGVAGPVAVAPSAD